MKFKDVGGGDEEKEEVVEVVELVKDGGKSGELGARIRKGVLVVGGGGRGKRLVGRGCGGEGGVGLLSMSGCELVEMLVGVGG